jgi:hypothetical protein
VSTTRVYPPPVDPPNPSHVTGLTNADTRVLTFRPVGSSVETIGSRAEGSSPWVMKGESS